MRLSVAAALVVFLLACLPAPADAQPHAGDCLIGPDLAPTLFFPYFEVDTADAGGKTTLLAVNNALNAAVLTRVVVWTDWGRPTMAFDIYLDPFDVQTINMRDLFAGNVPSTGAGADLSGFDNCITEPPSHSNPVATTQQRAQLLADHTGVDGPIFPGSCSGSFQADGVARGFVTVDAVRRCSGVEPVEAQVTPRQDGYFEPGGGAPGIATLQAQLWGDQIFIDPNNNAAQGSEAVALWADPTMLAGPDVFTFYGRHHSFDGRDHRAPLAWRWNQRFFNGGPFLGGAELLVWRDSESTDTLASCGSNPDWWPLDNGAVTTVDEQGDNVVSFDIENHFPNMTQRVPIDDISPPYAFGWIQLSSPGQQMWVQPVLTAGGLYSAGFNGFPISYLCGEAP